MKFSLLKALALLGAAALLTPLASCGGGGTETPPAAQRELALAVSRPGELVGLMQDKLRARQTQRQVTPGAVFDGTPATVAPTPTASSTATAPARSGPLAQEDGVDEADLLQTDGSHLYTLQPQGAHVLRVQAHVRGADGRASALGFVSLAAGAAVDVFSDGMHLSADGRSLAVISQAWVPLTAAEACPAGCGFAPQMLGSRVEVQRVDVSTPAAPAAGDRLSLDGSLVDSRRVGDALYLVTSHRPVLAAESLPAGATAAQREATIAALTAADLLPRVRRNGGAAEPLVAETDCYVQTGNASLGIAFTTITVIDLRSATLARTSRCFAGGTEALYMTASSLYLATTRYEYQPLSMAASFFYPADFKTDLHKFALAAGGVQYRGSGQVEGHLGWDTQRKSFRLSEHAGDLRVLTYTGMAGWFTIQDASKGVPASPAKLSVLRERSSGQSLQTVATLPNAQRPALLGKPGEQVYGVRFVGARGYVVTFRRTDPLYVLDLANPADPRIAGELELAGFSESLYPLDGGLLLGVGRDADSSGRVTGLKVALFDVADAAAPRLLAGKRFGGAASVSALDLSRHGLNYLVTNGVARIALPVNLSPAGSGWTYDGWTHGLQRFEVDLAARTLTERPMLGAAAGNADHLYWRERSLQIGEQVHHLAATGLTSYDW